MTEAGRELDALVAEKVFGWKWFDYPDHQYIYLRPADTFQYGAVRDGGRVQYLDGLPYFSTDIAAAWKVVEHFKRPLWVVQIYQGMSGITVAEIAEWENENVLGDKAKGVARSKSAPLAICLAALKAVSSS